MTTGRLTSITSAAFGGGGATHGVARRFSHTSAGQIDRQWFNAGLLGAAGSSVQGFDYDHDAHGRRETVRPYLPDGAPAVAVQPPGWRFGYNERSEVEQADRFKPSAASVEAGLVDHQRRSYVYDGMGNRETATLGTTTADLRQTGYSVNELQQYDGVTHSRSVEITGQAAAGAVVELMLDAGSPITVDRTLPQHQNADPHSFRYVHTVAGTEARWLHVKIKASAAGVHLTQQGFVYVPPASETVVHDDDGNLIEDAQWTYTWDAENRLTSATQKALPVASGLGLPAPARKKLTFAYDYRHRRIAKRVYQLEASASAPETPSWNLVKDQRFVYDGWNMIAELDHTTATSTGLAGSGVSRTFQWGPDLSGTMSGAGGVGGLLNLTKGGVMYAVCSDANGNVTGLVPTSGPGAGQLIARYDYDPFGNRITDTGSGAEICPFGFSTKYGDAETGMLYYGFRYYSPELGRWPSRDPIEERGGLNLYGMVGNDPVNWVDTLGLAPNVEYTDLESLVRDLRSEIIKKPDWADREYGTSIWILAPGGSWSGTHGAGFENTKKSWKYAYGEIKSGKVMDRRLLKGGGATVDDHSELSAPLKKKYCVVKLGTTHSHPHDGDPEGDMKKFKDSEGKEGRPPFSGGGFDGHKLGDIDKFNSQQYPFRVSHQMIFLLITGPEGRIWWYKPNQKNGHIKPDVSPNRFGGGSEQFKPD